MTPWFIATARFSPANGETWTKFIAWSGLTQLSEVVSLDGILNPPILADIRPDYWPHIVNEDFMLHFFTDFEFLKRQLAGTGDQNVLCVYRNPERRPEPPPVPDFQFLGYDLVDVQSGTSALTNCGGFPDVFGNSELSSCRLLPDLDRAKEVQARLRALHPGEPHADCHVWAIFRFR